MNQDTNFSFIVLLKAVTDGNVTIIVEGISTIENVIFIVMILKKKKKTSRRGNG